jgi:hypothetical protein
LYTFLINPMCTTWPTHLILLDLIILIFGEQYELCTSSCNFVQPPITSCLRSKYTPKHSVLITYLTYCAQDAQSSSITYRLVSTGPFRDSCQVNLCLVLWAAQFFHK